MKAVIKYFEQFKPKIKRQKNGLFSFLHIPIFATHERKDESPMTIDAEWMQRCVADQKELKDKFHRLPKVGVGHNDEESGQEKPAVFFLDNFQFDPKTGFLYADYVDVPEQWRDELTSNRWPNRSCEPSMTVPRIEYMALLGGRPGWLKALPDIHYAERTNKFKEILMPRAKYAELSEEIKQAIQSAVKSSLDGLLEELGADGVSGAAEPYEEGNDEVTKLKADAQKQADERGFAEKPKEGNPGDETGKDAEDARDDDDEDDESEDSLREKLLKKNEAEYKEMSKKALRAMWAQVTDSGEERKPNGKYPRKAMKGQWGYHADGSDKGHYAEQLQRTKELELEVEKLKASQRDQ